MSKPVLSVVAVVLLVSSFALGWWVGSERVAPKPPPRPRTPEQVAQWIETRGEIRGILIEHNVLARALALSKLLAGAGPEQVPAVVTLLQTGAFGLGSVEAGLLTRFWAMHDPEAAADYALKHSAPLGVRPIVAETAIETWATQDPQAAREFVDSYLVNVAGAVGETAMSAFVRGWYQSGEPGLEQFVKDLGQGAPQRRHLAAYVDEMIYREGVDAVVQWLDEFPDDDERFKRTAYRAGAPVLMKADREFAKAWCEKHCDRGYAEHARALMAREWAREDGPAALEWVSQAPAGDERDRAVWSTISDWRITDPNGAIAWVKGMDPDDVKPWLYPAVDRFANWLSWEQPLLAYRWAEHIQDPARREQVMITITHRYREVDEAGADAWLAQSPLSEEAREKASTLPPNYKGRGAGGLPGFLEPK